MRNIHSRTFVVEMGSLNIPQVDKKDLNRLCLTCKALRRYSQVTSPPYNLLHGPAAHHQWRLSRSFNPSRPLEHFRVGYLAARSGRPLFIGPLSRGPPSLPLGRVAEAMRIYLSDSLDALRSLQSVTNVVIQFSILPT
jgi:hypothetical protein